jgi:hypothetical protein
MDDSLDESVTGVAARLHREFSVHNRIPWFNVVRRANHRHLDASLDQGKLFGLDRVFMVHRFLLFGPGDCRCNNGILTINPNCSSDYLHLARRHT